MLTNDCPDSLGRGLGRTIGMVRSLTPSPRRESRTGVGILGLRVVDECARSALAGVIGMGNNDSGVTQRSV
jgi:hypothetical protein